jgi:hypothetical protein
MKDHEPAAGLEQLTYALRSPFCCDRPSSAAQGRVQLAKQLPDAPSSRWCCGIAAEHVDDDRRRASASLLDTSSADLPITAGHELGRSRGVGCCPEDVLHLVSVGQWVKVRGGCRTHRCSRRIRGGLTVCFPGRFVCRPPGVAQHLPAFAAACERQCGIERVARPRVGRVRALEDLQDFLGAGGSVAGDLAKILLAQNDLSGLRSTCVPSSPTGQRLGHRPDVPRPFHTKGHQPAAGLELLTTLLVSWVRRLARQLLDGDVVVTADQTPVIQQHDDSRRPGDGATGRGQLDREGDDVVVADGVTR